MRSRVTRLTGLVAGAALAVSPLLAVAPAHAEPGPDGTINLSIVDDLGQPVTGIALLIPERSDNEEEFFDPIILAGDERAESTYTEQIPAGKYGIITVGGWSLLSCAGLKSCDLLFDEQPEVAGNGAFTVPEGGSVSYKVTTRAPKLSGSGKVGTPIYADVPQALDGDRAAFMTLGEAGIFLLNDEDALEPTIRWLRDGVEIPRAKGDEYVPTAADAGSTITAQVKVPTALRMLARIGGFGPLDAPGVLPAPATLGPVTVSKTDSTTDVQVVGKRRVGKNPTAWFTVDADGKSVNNWITVTGAANKPLRLRLRDGFAKVDLKQLRAGKHTITATFAGTSAVNASSDTVTFTLKKAKPAKHKKNQKNHSKR